MLEWSDLRVLLALSRAGSVAGAARELRVDSSTISRRLAALEEAVEAKLLIRGGREFSWTCEGRAMVAAAETIDCAVAGALRAVRASKVEAQGNVCVSIAPAFLQPLMVELLPALRRAHPLLSVELRAAFARADLAKGEADIALRMARPEEPDLIARRAFDCAWFVYASESYLAARGRPRCYEELAQHELVLYADNLRAAPPTRWMDAYKGPSTNTTRVDSLEIASAAASAGGGIAVLPGFLGDPLPALRRVFAESIAVNTGFIVFHESVRDASRVRVVADALLEFFQTREALYAGRLSESAPAQALSER